MSNVPEPEPVNEENAPENEDDGVYVDEGEEVEEIDENTGETA